MLDRAIVEATQYEFKVAVELKKPKSWLKSVCAFANGIGGTIFFGVGDDGSPVGLKNIKEDSDKISELIGARISPIPQTMLKPFDEDGKAILALNVLPGRATPYFYKADGTRDAFVRIGNESIPAPDHIIKELTLKGTNQSFDSMITNDKRANYSFTLLEATYRERTGIPFEISDYVSFGLTDSNGYLTNAGRLMADQHIVYNSRIFCTRWNGLEKGWLSEDAVDDKEFEGGLVFLLQSARDFIKNNSHIRFVKGPEYRIEKPDYAERAITEILVNALIHRDYILKGAEIHVDMFDDRIEVVSPGGMWYGNPIQHWDISQLSSYRRNPVIADLFHRMRYMERRGSGLYRVLTETAKLPGYRESLQPIFLSDHVSFRVVLKSVNYGPSTSDSINEPQNQTGSTEKVTGSIESKIINSTETVNNSSMMPDVTSINSTETDENSTETRENSTETRENSTETRENSTETRENSTETDGNSIEKVNDFADISCGREKGNRENRENSIEKNGKTLREKILEILAASPGMTMKELGQNLGEAKSTVRYHVEKMKKSGKLRHEGPSKSGRWIIDHPASSEYPGR